MIYTIVHRCPLVSLPNSICLLHRVCPWGQIHEKEENDKNRDLSLLLFFSRLCWHWLVYSDFGCLLAFGSLPKCSIFSTLTWITQLWRKNLCRIIKMEQAIWLNDQMREWETCLIDLLANSFFDQLFLLLVQCLLKKNVFPHCIQTNMSSSSEPSSNFIQKLLKMHQWATLFHWVTHSIIVMNMGSVVYLEAIRLLFIHYTKSVHSSKMCVCCTFHLTLPKHPLKNGSQGQILHMVFVS